MAVHKDRVQEGASTTGTGTFSLNGTAPAGFRTFIGASIPSGSTVRYYAFSSDLSQWEVGEGVFTDGSPDTLTRVTMYATSTGSKINFTAAPQVMLAVVAADIDELGLNNFITNEIPTGSINGSNTTFTLSQTPVAGALAVYVRGVRQKLTTHYTVSGNTLTMGTAPETGDSLTVDYMWNVSNTGNADTVDGYHASATPTANKIPVLDADGFLPVTQLLGYAQITSQQTGATNTNDQDVTGLAVTVNVPTLVGNQKVKITCWAYALQTNGSAGADVRMRLKEGATILSQAGENTPASNYDLFMQVVWIGTPSAGSHTYKIAMQNGGSGRPVLQAGTDRPAFILVELV